MPVHRKESKKKKGESSSCGFNPNMAAIEDSQMSSGDRSSVGLSDKEFERQFEKFLKENFPDAATQKKMREMPKDNKWKLIATASAMKQNSYRVDETLKRMLNNVRGNPSVEALESLKIDLEQTDSSIIDQFIKQVGYGSLLNLLVKYSIDDTASDIPTRQNIVISCLRAIVNFKIFFVDYVKHPLAVKANVLTLSSRDDEAREKALELLISLTATVTGSGPVLDYLEIQAFANGSTNLMGFCTKFVEKKERSTSVLYLCMFLNALVQTSPLSTRKMIFEKIEELKLMDRLTEISQSYKIDLERKQMDKKTTKTVILDPTVIANHEEVAKRQANVIRQLEMIKKNQEETRKEVSKLDSIGWESDNIGKMVDSLIFEMNSSPNNDKFETTIKNLKLISKKAENGSSSLVWRAVEAATNVICEKLVLVNNQVKTKEFRENPVASTDDSWSVLKLFGFVKDLVPSSGSKDEKGQQKVEELPTGRYSLSREYFKELEEKVSVKYPDLEAKARTFKLNIESLEKELAELKTKMSTMTQAPANAGPQIASLPKFMDGSNQPPETAQEKPAETSVPAMGGPAMGRPAMGKPAMGGGPAMGKPAMGGGPAMGAPAMGKPAMGGPAMGGPAMGAPAMGAPAMGRPAMGAPAMGGPKMMGAPSMGAPKGGMGSPGMGMMMMKPAVPSKPKKKNEKPDVPVKRIMWERISDQNVEKTFWNSYGLDDEKVSLGDIKQKFSLDSMMSSGPGTGDASPSSTEQKSKALSIIPASKSKNMSIALTRIRKSCEEIKRAVIEMDLTSLSQDHLESLVKNALPDKEDIDKVRDYVDNNPYDDRKLPLAEEFVLTISTIPMFDQRMKNWAFSLSFESQLATLTKELDILTLSFTALKDSTKFKRFLRLTLAVGNYMNGGTPQGGAYGFKLGTLASLRTCRDTNNERTLLNYILELCYNEDEASKEDRDVWNDFEKLVRTDGYDSADLRGMHQDILKSSHPILGFIVEFSLFNEAKNIGISENKQELKELVNKFEMLKSNITAIGTNEPGDRFVDTMTKFVEEHASKLANASTLTEAVDTLFKNICTEYGENPDSLTPAELVGKIATFVNNCEISLNENKQDRETKPRSQMVVPDSKNTELAQNSKDPVDPSKKTQSNNKPRGIQGPGLSIEDMSEKLGSDGAGLLDGLMSALSDGDGFKTLKRKRIN